jgi:hypothetical protein
MAYHDFVHEEYVHIYTGQKAIFLIMIRESKFFFGNVLTTGMSIRERYKVLIATPLGRRDACFVPS